MDTLSFPIFMYRSPGPHQMPGGTYELKYVMTTDEADSALLDGWQYKKEECVQDDTDNSDTPKKTTKKRGRPPKTP